MKILRYARCGYIVTNEATHISCNSDEIKKALKLFNKTSDVPQLTLTVNERNVYLYNDKWTGYKRSSSEYIDNYDAIISFCCKKETGRRRVQKYSSLFNEIKCILNDHNH